jgi:hypothetical protein
MITQPQGVQGGDRSRQTVVDELYGLATAGGR